MGRLDGTVALITGGARGQGRSHAVGLAQEGADIVVTDLCEDIAGVNYPLARREDLDETVALVEKSGRRCLARVADARDGARMRAVVDDAVAELGRLDTVVINHGIAIPTPYDPSGLDHFDTVIETNLSAVFRTAVAAIPHLRERGGSITVTGSSASLITLFNNPAYTAAKHGLIGLVKSLAADLAQDWIRVNAICPTAVSTDLLLNEYNVSRFCPGRPDATYEDMKVPATALNLLPVPWIEPEVVTRAVLYLAGDDGRYVTGIALPVDAGTTIQPPGITPFLGRLMAERS